VFDLLIVAVLVLLNGLFALSELAVVSARLTRLKTMSAEGRKGAQSALRLAADPGRFLSSVQIGITLIGIANGAYSGEAFGGHLSEALQGLGLSRSAAQSLGYGIVIAVITYLSVIIGELVPKTVALRNPEEIACAVSPVMVLFSWIAAPAVGLLHASTRVLFRIFGESIGAKARVTDEELRTFIAEAETAGIIEAGERQMISGVMRLADRSVAGLMTPRVAVDWIDINASNEEVKDRLIASPHSRLPAGEGSVDALMGVVQTRELLTAMLEGRPLDWGSYVRKAPIIPETTTALTALRVLREASEPMVLIHDEFGHFEGLATPADILKAIAGVFRSDVDSAEPLATERDDGSWLFSGIMPVDEMADRIGIKVPQQRGYQTVAGFVLAHLERLPQTGESVNVSGWRFEVVDLDGRRIDKVLASRLVVPHRRGF
jgi:putative hemolysin